MIDFDDLNALTPEDIKHLEWPQLWTLRSVIWFVLKNAWRLPRFVVRAASDLWGAVQEELKQRGQWN